jgi:hypothetical protein
MYIFMFLPFPHQPRRAFSPVQHQKVSQTTSMKENLKRAKEVNMLLACKFAPCSTTAQNFKICFLFL